MIACVQSHNSEAMPLRTDTFDLGALRLTTGEGRRLELNVAIDPFVLGGERYPVDARSSSPSGSTSPAPPATATRCACASTATLAGPCMRCLEPAAPSSPVDAREVSQPGETDELASPYVERGVLDLRRWARDALALALPATLLCRPDCAGLCPVCGADLNVAGAGASPRARAGSALGEAVRAAVRAIARVALENRRLGRFAQGITTWSRGPASLLARWPSPSRSSHTREPRSVDRSTRSARRRTTPARSATAPGFRTGSARCAGATRAARFSPSPTSEPTEPPADGHGRRGRGRGGSRPR